MASIPGRSALGGGGGMGGAPFTPFSGRGGGSGSGSGSSGPRIFLGGGGEFFPQARFASLALGCQCLPTLEASRVEFCTFLQELKKPLFRGQTLPPLGVQWIHVLGPRMYSRGP